MPVGYSVYQDKPSFLHQRLDPRTKFAWVMAMFALSLTYNHPLPLGFLLALNIGLGLWSRLRVKDFVAVFSLTLMMVVLSAALWPFYIDQGEVLFRVFQRPITIDGVLYGVAMGFRIGLMMAASSLWMMTTSPQKVTLGFLGMRLPYKGGMAISTTIRFVPFLINEVRTIIEAQQARAARFFKGNPIRRLYRMISIIVPLFSSAFMLAQELAVAMDARGFGARPGRTSIGLIQLTRTDRWILITLLLIVILSILLRVLGIGVLVTNYL